MNSHPELKISLNYFDRFLFDFCLWFDKLKGQEYFSSEIKLRKDASTANISDSKKLFIKLIYVEKFSCILSSKINEYVLVLPNFSNPQYNSDTFVSDEISVELDDNLNIELEMLRFRSEEISDDIDSFEIPNLFTLALCGSILAGLLCTICMIKSNNKANSFTITKTANKHQNMLESSKSDGQYNHRPSSGDVSLDMSLASDDSRNFLIK
jgi:hypothetical protein